MGKYLVGMDAGTTGCKVCVFDLEGNLIGSDYREYPCYYPHEGWVEQIPEDMVPALFATTKEALRKAQIEPKEVLAIGLSAQGSPIGLLDDDGELIRPFVGWQDLRGGQKELDWIQEHISREDHYRITGDPLGTTFSIAKHVWLKHNEPENWEKTAMYSTHMDYFLKVLGADDYYTDFSSASRDGTMDIDNNEWSQIHHDMLGIPLSKRPKIVAEPGKVVGYIPADVAEKTGLLEGTPVCMGAHDQNCNTFGSGGIDDGTAIMVMGTFGSCFVISDKSIRDPNGKLVVKGNHGVGNYTIEAFANTSASSYRWFRDTFCEMEKYAGGLSGIDPYEIINDKIARTPIGANGITFLPYLQGAAGARLNDKARGTFIGMSLGTDKKDIARAVMEGTCYEMYDIINAELAAGIKLDGIRLTGGAAKSPMWSQMLADITKQKIMLLSAEETGCLGAALYAGVGIGVYDSPRDASNKAVKITKTFDPNPAKYEAYDKAYKRFGDLYNALNGTIY